VTAGAPRARLIVLAAVLDLVNGILFLVAGVTIFQIVAMGFSESGEPSQYGAGMLIGGIGLVATVAGIVCLVHGYWCWRTLRRSDIPGTGLRTFFILLVPAVATVVSAWLALRLLG
jgi:hypothetical protein